MRTPSACPLIDSAANRSPRSGFALVAALIVLAIASILASSMLRRIHLSRNESAGFERAAQTQWLVESGLERARHKLSLDPDYRGEVWRIDAAKLGGSFQGLVRIELKPVANEPDQFEAMIQAQFPAGLDERVQRTRTFPITSHHQVREPDDAK